MSKAKRYMLLTVVLIAVVGDAVYFAVNRADAGALFATLWPALRSVLIGIGGIALLAAIVAGISIWLKARRAHHA